MAKLTRAQRRELELIRLDLKRAQDYISRPDVAVCRVGGVATTTLHMTRQMDGKIFYEVNKEIGSNLCGMGSALQKLERLLERALEPVV
jgi:hypothetical protein